MSALTQTVEVDAKEVRRIANQARHLLAGRPAAVQSAVLADLLAIYLAGHIVRGDPVKTDVLREQLLDLHVDLVRQLVPVNAATIHGPR